MEKRTFVGEMDRKILNELLSNIDYYNNYGYFTNTMLEKIIDLTNCRYNVVENFEDKELRDEPHKEVTV